jgi:hypothetical protein
VAQAAAAIAAASVLGRGGKSRGRRLRRHLRPEEEAETEMTTF